MTQGSTIADVLAGRSAWVYECRDGFALAKDLEEGAVTHTISDPPYDAHTHEGMRTNRKGAGDASDIDFAALPEVSSFLPSLLRIAKRWTILFCSGTMLGDYLRGAGGWRPDGHFVRDGYWYRTNSAPQKTGDRPAQPCEALAIMHRMGGKMRWNRGGAQAMWKGSIDPDPVANKAARPGIDRIHPTKKPLWLMEALLRDFTDPDDLIFDPCGGEGTTGEACMRLGRRFIGCEIDPRYHAAGVERIGRAAAGMKQGDLFGT